jgi:hypothetical protein
MKKVFLSSCRRWSQRGRQGGVDYQTEEMRIDRTTNSKK